MSFRWIIALNWKMSTWIYLSSHFNMKMFISSLNIYGCRHSRWRCKNLFSARSADSLIHFDKFEYLLKSRFSSMFFFWDISYSTLKLYCFKVFFWKGAAFIPFRDVSVAWIYRCCCITGMFDRESFWRIVVETGWLTFCNTFGCCNGVFWWFIYGGGTVALCCTCVVITVLGIDTCFI